MKTNLWRFFLLFLVIIVMIEGKKKKAKSKTAEKEGEAVRSFSSDKDETFKRYVKDLEGDPDELSSSELMKYQQEEWGLRKDLDRIRQRYGALSKEHGDALHALGRNIYKQQRFEEVYALAKEIVKIHEAVDGPEHINTAKALTNIGSTAFKLGKARECETAMNRALFIFLKEYGAESKEVLIHRGQMLSFHIPFAKTSEGISYDDYLFEL